MRVNVLIGDMVYICYKKLKRKHYILIFLTSVLLLCCFYVSLNIVKTSRQLIELEKCPACFGVNLCPDILRGHLTFDDDKKFVNFLNFLGSKNVFFAHLNKKKVVIKKLGHNWELDEFDKSLCSSKGCKVSESILEIESFSKRIRDHISLPDIDQTKTFSNIILCPHSQNLDLLLKSVLLFNKNVDIETLYANIYTSVAVNAEPLILQILSQDDGWPVPKYYGACGRLIVEENAGEMLSNFMNTPWELRVNIAIRLLQAAADFTNKHPNFRFYLTDISWDNIVVNTLGLPYFVDMENIIIVDRNILIADQPKTWSQQHVSKNYNCSSCFEFSPHDICSHHISDHNFFVVCQHILSPSTALIPGGLLHSTPSKFSSLQSKLNNLLFECAESPLPGRKSQAAEDLMILLSALL